MNNYEWIQSLNKEDLAKWLTNQECIDICSFADADRDCIEEDYPCFRGILEWLDMEVGEQPKSEKNLTIENYADLFISHIISDINNIKVDYKEVVKQVTRKMMEKIHD